MHDGPEDPDREDNLWRPLSGDRGAHGSFDQRARDRSPQLWLATHPAVFRGAAIALGVAGGILSARRGRAQTRRIAFP
jgi:hypothetical protein